MNAHGKCRGVPEKTGNYALVGRCGMRGVTIVELLIGFAIFAGVMGLVVVSLVQTFRSFHQGERFADKQQKQRICFVRMGRTIQSLVNIAAPGKAPSFRGDGAGFYIVFAQEENLAEEKYTCAGEELVRHYQSPADYSEATYEAGDACLSGLAQCGFSYSTGSEWITQWRHEDGLPKAVRFRFKFKDDDKEHEFLTNVPLGE